MSTRAAKQVGLDAASRPNARRVPHCSHWGAYTLFVDGNNIFDVEPFAGDPSPSPIIGSVMKWADPKHRVLQPLVRKGWLAKREKSDGRDRGSDSYVAVSWDEALDLVSGEIDRVRSTFGNESIFAGSYGWTSCGRFHHAATLLKRMLNLAGGYTGHVDTYSAAAGPVILRHTLGSDQACNGQLSTLHTIAEHTETLVVFGALSPRTAQNEAGGIGRHMIPDHLRRMKERGVRIILISPVRDDLPDWVDADWWPIRPNTDAALMLGLAGEVVAAGREDRDFLSRCCSGVDTFLSYLTGKSDGVVKNAKWAQGITEIDAERIKSLAAILSSTRSMITVSLSLQRADHGEQSFWAALGLASVTGQIGLPGGGVGYGYGSLGGVGAPYVSSRAPAMSQLDRPIRSFIPVSRITDLLLRPGEPFEYEGATHVYPDTRMVFWAGGNPFHHQQDINRLRQGWAKPETIVVQDPIWTATARRADIVLPASTSLERNDLAGNRRSDHIFAMHKAIEPLGEARSDYEIFRALADRLGNESAFSEGRDEMEWIRHLYDLSRADAKSKFDYAMPDFETFWEKGWAEVPTQRDYTYLAGFRQNPDAAPLATESGKIVLGSKTLATLGYEDCLPHPAWIPPAEWLGSNANAGKLQFHLISRQPDGKLHSQLDFAPTSLATKRNNREPVQICPSDAEHLGIYDGQTVRISNERGACLATALINPAVRAGVAVLPTGSWYAPVDHSAKAMDLSGNPNVLTLDKGSSRFSQGCSAHTCLITIEPFGEPELSPA